MALTKKNIAFLFDRLFQIKQQLEDTKPIYREFDEITDKLVDNGVFNYKAPHMEYVIEDQFKGKNTAFKACGFKRYDLAIYPISK